MALSAAVFLDKDGTVLEDAPYNVDPQRMRFAPGAQEGLARLATLGCQIIVVTNQPGIALGKFNAGDISAVQHRLAEMFGQAGAELAGFYFCPHHPEGVRPAWSRLCTCRKPAPGLLHIAAARQHIALRRSWMVGDILDDVEAGRRAGCRAILLNNGNETEWISGEWRTPDHIAADLDDASRWIAAQYARESQEAPA
jgi:histidinol-phosphate phosphatase family protein